MPRLPYYIVELRPWPILLASRIMLIAISLINWFYFYDTIILTIRLITLLLSIFQWSRDVIRETTYIGKHTSYLQKLLRMGIILFILREVCFFISFFWRFFHISLAPRVELGCNWPPAGIKPIDPIGVPLLNTIILLASGFTVTWSHYCLLNKKRVKSIIILLITTILGRYFTYLQAIEYYLSRFTITDRVYGSLFFLITGFHGIHVIIGTLFLLINMLRILKNHFSSTHHFRFEAASWYWHFVDVVWICLYICVYWWGSL